MKIDTPASQLIIKVMQHNAQHREDQRVGKFGGFLGARHSLNLEIERINLLIYVSLLWGEKSFFTRIFDMFINI